MSQGIEVRSNIREQIEKNLLAIRQRMQAAANRSAHSVEPQLVAVTKYAQPEWVAALIELGQLVLGENRPQQMVQRAAMFPDSVEWHLIGQLQRNKVRPTLQTSRWIHSVDSVRLLTRVDLIAGELNVRPRLLLEINTSQETAKSGFSPQEIQSVWSDVIRFNHIDIAGFMTMAPRVSHAEDARPYFHSLRTLRDVLASDERPLTELSMGMSGDFEIAIEEGATLVRIGSSLYEGLEPDSVAS